MALKFSEVLGRSEVSRYVLAMEDSEPPHIELKPHDRGCVQLTANADWNDLKEFVHTIQESAEDTETVEAYNAPWAGPYEILLAASGIFGALGGGVGGIAGVIALFSKRHPQYPITITIGGDSKVVVVNGVMTDREAQLVNEMFAANDTSPIAEGRDYGPGLNRMDWTPPS
jgi:hypothetical protein